ncbi:MAG: ParB/RepB/Spo0J family partition protein [Desulfuromonas sp.]|nr:ParB/RepB/Spo0J family partition protein [Desulfuromonas sp.]
MVYEENKLYEIPLAQLKSDPHQPRKHFADNALAELKKTIQNHGVLQPVLFTTSADKNLILISGERRYRAAKLAGLSTIPAIYKNQPSLEIAIIENIVRENLSPVEEAEAIQRLIDENICRQRDLPAKLGKAKSTISEILSLNRLPEEIKDECRSNNRVPRGILVEIAKKRKSQNMTTLYQKYKERGLTRGEVRKVSRKASATAPGVAINATIRQLNKKIDQIYELGFDNDEEKRAVENQLHELYKQIELRLRKTNTAKQPTQKTLEFNF